MKQTFGMVLKKCKVCGKEMKHLVSVEGGIYTYQCIKCDTEQTEPTYTGRKDNEEDTS